MTPTMIQVIPPWPLEEFLSKQGATPKDFNDRRQYARRHYRHTAVLHLQTTLPSFEREAQKVQTYTSDFSRTGAAFLSACELYPREVVDLEISGIGMKRFCVVRCRRLANACFEIGARLLVPV